MLVNVEVLIYDTPLKL